MTDMNQEPWIDEARQIAAQCWCHPETSSIVMDGRLAEAVARTVAVWMETGAQHARNEAYWRERTEKAEQQLAESQAREAALSGSLLVLKDAEKNNKWIMGNYYVREVFKALALPSDDSALKEMLRKEWSVMAAFARYSLVSADKIEEIRDYRYPPKGEKG